MTSGMTRVILSAVLGIGLLESARAEDLYVTTNGTGNGSSWAEATNSIQGAINAISGDYPTNTVWVSNGVYQTGGLKNYSPTNRVVIWKAITVRSANNDPANTIIKGAWDPNTNGPAAVRCVYMVGGSSLIGFTLTNGATLTGGDTARLGGGVYSYSGSGTYTTTNTIISNCVIAGNRASFYGGGAAGGTLYNCAIIDNQAIASGNGYGGGAIYATLFNCAIIDNKGNGYGGGVYNSTLYNCAIVRNSVGTGGAGAYGSTLYNCAVISNCSSWVSGGASGGALYSCAIVGNESRGNGGGADGSILYNCTVVGNKSVSYTGGGVNGNVNYNCIVLSNSPGNYAAGCTFTNSCTWPTQTTWKVGDGNITNDPMVIAWGNGYGTNHVPGNYHLTKDSPCINAGIYQGWMATNTLDLDSRLRIRYGVVDMGCYEYLSKGTVISYQ